jgi:aldehyde dehydrogenase (NAD(P)+)
MPKKWSKKENLMTALISILKDSKRFNYYPGSDERVDEYRQRSDQPFSVNNNTETVCFINKISSEVENWHGQNEVFASAMSICEIENNDAKSYLEKAILFANEKLYGSLGANILIHPKTIEEIGKQNFEKIIQNLKYGTIAVNGWSALGFLLSQCPWGAYPGHTLEDIQSGIGTVHNALMLSDTERSVIWAPWRPFPRGILSGQFSMLPKPPWFISNKRQDKLGMLLTRFEYKRSWLKIPRIFFNALLG